MQFITIYGCNGNNNHLIKVNAKESALFWLTPPPTFAKPLTIMMKNITKVSLIDTKDLFL